MPLRWPVVLITAALVCVVAAVVTGKAEQDVQRLFERIGDYEATVGLDRVDPTLFVRNPDWPSAKASE